LARRECFQPQVDWIGWPSASRQIQFPDAPFQDEEKFMQQVIDCTQALIWISNLPTGLPCAPDPSAESGAGWGASETVRRSCWAGAPASRIIHGEFTCPGRLDRGAWMCSGSVSDGSRKQSSPQRPLKRTEWLFWNVPVLLAMSGPACTAGRIALSFLALWNVEIP